ncbi:MAG: ORF6N domain-containing protein [Candidatus Omnitrophica bacterium]|nr:ORF6N domain-containing protein [Candidatus Omnitrophota bacterium]
MFQLTKEEFENWKSQIAISNSEKMGLRRKPYAFTEQGVAIKRRIGFHPGNG